MTTAPPYSIPQEPGRWRALALATAVHLGLFALLWIGIRWQSQTPVTLEAEVWSPQVQEAAPPPEPSQTIQPEPLPAAVEKPPPVAAEPAVEKPDIALEQKKKRKEEKDRQEKLAQKEAEQRLADEKSAALAKKNNGLEKAKLEKKRLQEQAEEKQREKTRDDEMRRISGNAAGSGDAVKSQGSHVDSSYSKILSAKIKSHIIFIVPADLRGNPSFEYTLELFPDGYVQRIVPEHPSGLPGFDEAVQRAIHASEPFPPDQSGVVPRSIPFSNKPKEK